MKVNIYYTQKLQIVDAITIQNTEEKANEIFMGRRICANCGHERDTLGAKTCSNGHFICHSCAKNHIHCPLCRKTLR